MHVALVSFQCSTASGPMSSGPVLSGGSMKGAAKIGGACATGRGSACPRTHCAKR